MEQVFRAATRLLEKGDRGMLCTLVRTQGSTPRKAGAIMLVYAEGQIEGTIGGGMVEKETIRLALESINRPEPFLHAFQLGSDHGMHCGGSMEIFFQPLGWKPELFILGAGHVGKATARLASEYGFRVHLVDGRPGILEAGVPETVQCHPLPFGDCLAQLAIPPKAYVVVCTPDHATDQQLTGGVARLHLAYLGMIGSRSKTEKAKVFFRDVLGLEDALIDRIDMPIGVPISVETPAEIALSIVARLVDRRNSLSGRSPK